MMRRTKFDLELATRRRMATLNPAKFEMEHKCALAKILRR